VAHSEEDVGHDASRKNGGLLKENADLRAERVGIDTAAQHGLTAEGDGTLHAQAGDEVGQSVATLEKGAFTDPGRADQTED
jgi:hypothetical protein